MSKIKRQKQSQTLKVVLKQCRISSPKALALLQPPLPQLCLGRDVQPQLGFSSRVPGILAEASMKEGGWGGDQAERDKGQP